MSTLLWVYSPKSALSFSQPAEEMLARGSCLGGARRSWGRSGGAALDGRACDRTWRRRVGLHRRHRRRTRRRWVLDDYEREGRGGVRPEPVDQRGVRKGSTSRSAGGRTCRRQEVLAAYCPG